MKPNCNEASCHDVVDVGQRPPSTACDGSSQRRGEGDGDGDGGGVGDGNREEHEQAAMGVTARKLLWTAADLQA